MPEVTVEIPAQENTLFSVYPNADGETYSVWLGDPSNNMTADNLAAICAAIQDALEQGHPIEEVSDEPTAEG